MYNYDTLTFVIKHLSFALLINVVNKITCLKHVLTCVANKWAHNAVSTVIKESDQL